MELHGAYFDIATGRLLIRDPATKAYAPVVENLTTHLTGAT
jgi:nitrite reductase/ring-hydroxylating ferredoxin subunit